MREILFRGKTITSKEWIYGDLLQYAGGAQIWENTEQGKFNAQIIPETVGQYTGIKDKTEKKVFEHDIVKAYDLIEEISFIGVVKYLDGSFCICDTDFCSYYHWEYYEVEVIGNIFDNPELIGGNK